MSSDIFDCHNYWESGISFIIQWDAAKHSTVFREIPPTKSYLPKMSIVFKLGNPGLEGKDQKRGQNESEMDGFLWHLLSALS